MAKGAGGKKRPADVIGKIVRVLRIAAGKRSDDQALLTSRLGFFGCR
jgi:hypothetical protein